MTAVRVLGALAGLLAALAAGQPAGAHPLTTTLTIPVDEPAAVRIQVAAEGRSAMVGVDLELPDGFLVERPGEPPGWTVSVEPGRLRYRGPQVPIGGTATFDLVATATRPAKLTIPVITFAADGTTVEWRGGDFPAVDIYAGVSPADAGGADGAGGDGGDGGNFGVLMAVGAAGTAVAVAGVLALRRRRAA